MSTEVHEEIIEAPPEDVWGFMVDPAALSAWFGADAWLEPEPDGIVRFRFADGAERRGRVEHVAPCPLPHLALARAPGRGVRQPDRRANVRHDRAAARPRGHPRAHHRAAGVGARRANR